MRKQLLFQIFVVSFFIASCSSFSTTSDPPTPSVTTIPFTEIPTITHTATHLPTPTITPAIIEEIKIGNLAITENNVRSIVDLSSFGTPNKYCLNSSQLDAALETRLIDGQVEYLLATTDLDSQNINLWNLTPEKLIQTFDSSDVDSVLFHPDQKTLISFSRYEPGTLTLWDIQDGNERQKFTFKSNYYYDERISISQNGLRIALFSGAYNAGNLHVSEFNLQTTQLIDTDYDFPLYYETPPPHIYSPKGDLIAITYNEDNKLHFLNLSKRKDTILPFPFESRESVFLAEAIISTVAMSSDERYLVGGGLDGDIYVWDTENGTLIASIEAHIPDRVDGWVGGIKILEFSPESYLLLSVGYDGYTKLWNASTGELLKEIRSCHHFGGFTEDGRYLVTVGKAGIDLWGVP